MKTRYPETTIELLTYLCKETHTIVCVLTSFMFEEKPAASIFINLLCASLVLLIMSIIGNVSFTIAGSFVLIIVCGLGAIYSLITE